MNQPVNFTAGSLFGMASAEGLASGRLDRAKVSYTTRRVPARAMQTLLTSGQPRSGDLIVARVEQLGQHQHLESVVSRRAKLWPGDEIIVAYGNRYAPDQFEAYVPADLGLCHLVAGGGVAARVASRHGGIRPATTIRPIGLIGDADGKRINLFDWRLSAATGRTTRPLTIAVLGSSMNAGKTTTCAAVVRGLAGMGLRVGAAKITGTGSGGDRWSVADAGADPVFDFTDAGYATTFGFPADVLADIMTTLTDHLAAAGVQASVLEIADGLLQKETAALAASRMFARGVDGVVFAANGAMSALAGVEWLRRAGLPVLAVSGVVTASPLASREAADATGLPVIGPEELATGDWYSDLIGQPRMLALA